MEIKEYFKNYTDFVDSVTAEVSKNDAAFTERFKQLSVQLGGNYSRLDNAIAGLAGESGEVADLWKKVKYHGLEYDAQTREKFQKELGDVCWYLFQTAYALNMPMNEIIDANVAKLKQRHSHGFSAEYMQQKKGD
ncbi:MAG: hypothetical protein IJ218_02365 [Alphaproteobacteria bacterium]|nr:hypothetical protein [Alphaproteobacteria bacterium]